LAIGIYFAPENMTREKYDEVWARLEAAGAAAPKGRSYHVSFIEGEKLHVFDIWDSQQDFDAFGQTLMPILADLGIEVGQPSVSPIHRVVAG
jgi:hypothetical protein